MKIFRITIFYNSLLMLLLVIGGVQCVTPKSDQIPHHSNDPYSYRIFYDEDDSSFNTSQANSPYTNHLDDNLFQVYENEVLVLSKTVNENISRMHTIFSSRNTKLVKRLYKVATENPSPIRAKINKAFVEKIRLNIKEHPVVGEEAFSKFDPNYQVGFCFGRATYVHLLLSRMGVPQHDMAKIFAFGQLMRGGLMWNFHMATIVRGYDSAKKHEVWWVVDSLFDEVVELREWTKRVSKFSIHRELSDVRFYTTVAKKFQPAFGEYQAKDLQIAEYNGFFGKLYMSLLKN